MSRYGAIAKTYAAANPQAKIFFVAKSDSTFVSQLQEQYPVDEDGVVRVHTTISAALDSCVADRGDVILVMPGYSETITAAGGLDLDVAGVSIIGLGTGDKRPTINFSTATTADIDVDAANISLENFIIDLTGVDALAAPIDVNDNDFALRKCKVLTASASGQATLAVLTDANAGGLVIEDCQFLGTSDAGTEAAVRIVGGDAHVIRRNIFIGAYTTTLGAIDNATTACTNTIIEDNHINNLTASSTKAMVFVSTSTGVIRRNHMQILFGTAPITGAAMSWAGANYYAATIATAGTLI